MTTHKHTKARRRFLGVPVGWAVAILAGAGVAVAAFLYLLGASGDVTTGSAEVIYITGTPPTIASGDCSTTYPDDHTMDVQWLDVLPDEVCQINGILMKEPTIGSNSTPLALQGFDTDLPEVSASIGAKCGEVLTPGDPNFVGSVTLTVDSGIAQNMAFQFGPDAGFSWVIPSSYDPGQCQ